MAFKHLISGGLLVFAFSTATCAAETRTIGVMNFTHDAAHRDRLVQTTLFYPGETGGYPEWLGDNAVFKGVRVVRDAKPERRKHPLIIISHGSGGNAANLAWLAERLAEQGFVVAIPNHQGSTSADSTPETTIPAVWERPADISTLIDALSASTAVSAIVDKKDIAALGFSLGGQTVLALAGVEFHAAGLARYCDENANAMECVWLDKGNALIPGHVDLHKIDTTRFDASHLDGRISRIIAIDPAFVPSLDSKSLGSVADKVQIINLGSDQAIPRGVRADGIAAAIKSARYDTIAGANHFDFLGECKRFGWFYIWMEGDDPVCTQSGGRSRADLHDEIAAKILSFLKPDQS
jgi:predicted dienelactone hydrolase